MRGQGHDDAEPGKGDNEPGKGDAGPEEGDPGAREGDAGPEVAVAGVGGSDGSGSGTHAQSRIETNQGAGACIGLVFEH